MTGPTAVKIRDNPWFGERAVAIQEHATSSMAYFRERYSLATNAEQRLDSLIGQRGNNLRKCIVDGFAEQANPDLVVRGCGAVCFRLRNNLFHGGKAAYAFAGQRENFTHGVRFLNSCLSVLA